jgi:hypothetical protein
MDPEAVQTRTSHTPEQKPMDFELNDHVKEIDFLSLDDILGNDEANGFTSKRAAKDLVDEDDNADMENSSSGSRLVWTHLYYSNFSTLKRFGSGSAGYHVM